MKIKKLLVPALSLTLLVPAFGTAKAEEMKPTVNTPAAQLRADLVTREIKQEVSLKKSEVFHRMKERAR
ncbi:hypothetical protein [Bacillus sp. V2I10]|uniref:hypothetical protein n=1 Tax=Bacillus sp. V2I10 TaxID=3042276 RepID=UPI002782A2C8|nr:hypothetical protein [Bacillus sp. V2I10]MDQ0860984.1 hypothetical protein [Bacillus sp. V2I10]